MMGVAQGARTCSGSRCKSRKRVRSSADCSAAPSAAPPASSRSFTSLITATAASRSTGWFLQAGDAAACVLGSNGAADACKACVARTSGAT